MQNNISHSTQAKFSLWLKTTLINPDSKEAKHIEDETGEKIVAFIYAGKRYSLLEPDPKAHGRKNRKSKKARKAKRTKNPKRKSRRNKKTVKR